MRMHAADGDPGLRERLRAAAGVVFERRSLRRTLRIALVVGVVLSLINEGLVIFGGHAGAATWARVALNFVVPFLVSNAGVLSARR